MHRTWSFYLNPFRIASLRGYPVAYKIAKYTNAALLAEVADPDIAIIFAFYNPLFVNFENEYVAWEAQHGTQFASTKTVDDLLYEIASGDEHLGIESKINEWDLAVQSVGPTFRKGTANYLAIFPNGHASFQHGAKDQRILAVKTLSEQLATFPGPAILAIKTDVDPSYAALDAARIAQQGEIAETGTDTTALDEQMNGCMDAMMSVYGRLVTKFSTNLDSIAPFFDEATIRNFPQTEWDLVIPPGEEIYIAKRTLAPVRKAKLTVISDRPVAFYMADEKNDPIRNSSVVVQGLEDETVEAQNLMDTPASAFIKAINTDPGVAAHIKIKILPEGA